MTLSVSLSIYLKTQVFKVYDAINLHSSLCCRENIFEQKTKKSTASKLEHLQLNYCQKRMNWYLEMILNTFKLLNLLLKYNFIVIFDHQLILHYLTCIMLTISTFSCSFYFIMFPECGRQRDEHLDQRGYGFMMWEETKGRRIAQCGGVGVTVCVIYMITQKLCGCK